VTARRVFASACALLFAAQCVAVIALANDVSVIGQDKTAADGAAIYKERCATCHEPGAAVRAPFRDVLATMPAAKITAALAPD
jgi:mono/diheme cytochrome c family protein